MKSNIQAVLNSLNFKPKKHLGQNFLIDKQILDKIIRCADLSENDSILEIGPGIGVLTSQLLNSNAEVYGIEIDEKLSSYLLEKFEKYENFHLIQADILEVKLPEYTKVVSNIPFSITGPIFENVFFKANPVPGILTIEKKIADRIFYEDNYKNFSRITVSVNSFLNPVKKIDVPQSAFYPPPKIPICLVKLEPRKNIDSFLKVSETRMFYLDLIAGIMPYKNKKMSNAITYYSKTSALQPKMTKKSIKILLKNHKVQDKKIFMYSIADFIVLAKILYEKKGKR
jgi:16S rRNA (adenine1518-N6/adenine1519-N6)-dimethyltransferase